MTEGTVRWFDADRFHRSGLPSIFTAPLIHDDERIGVIGFHSPRFGPDRLPSDEDRMLLRGLGALASIGIINARLFEKVANERRRRVALSKQQRALRDQLGHLREDARRDSAVNTLIGRSETLLKVLDEIRTVAAADTQQVCTPPLAGAEADAGLISDAAAEAMAHDGAAMGRGSMPGIMGQGQCRLHRARPSNRPAPWIPSCARALKCSI